MGDTTPPVPPGSEVGADPSRRNPLVTALFALTLLGAFVQGLVVLHWQVQTLNSMKPRSHRAQPETIAHAPTTRSGTSHSGASHISSSVLTGPRTVSFAAAPAGALKSSYQLSTEELFETYRAHYVEKGIRDEEYITLLALNHADRAWSAALSKAEREMDSGSFDNARQTLEDALAATDPRNLIGRARVLEFLRQLEVRAGNPDRARELGHQFDENRIHAAEIVVRATSGPQGGVAEGEAQQLILALKTEEEGHDVVNQSGKTVSDQGQDPEKAPERIANTLMQVTRAKADIGKAD